MPKPDEGRAGVKYFPEFGVKRENHVIVFTCSREIPLGLSYRIQKVRSRNQ